MKLLDRPKVRDGFRQALAESECPTPWRTHDSDPGRIVDHTGEEVCVVDNFADATARRVANLICQAVNWAAAKENGND